MSKRSEGEIADAFCALLAGTHYENFIVASRLQSPQTRTDLARIYAYCRTTDDLGDESGTQAQALARLERWRAEVADLFAGGAVVHPVLVALRDTVSRRRLTSEPFLALIDANVQDQRVTSYESWPELRAYCTRSAAPVGRMVLQVFGMTGPTAQRLSDDVCIGLQLANFAQDVGVDAAKGRTYLLQSDLREVGLAGATQAHCERARTLLASGCELETMAPRLLRLQLALYRLGGLAIIDAIARAGYRTDTSRPRVSAVARALTLARACLSTLLGNGHVGSIETA